MLCLSSGFSPVFYAQLFDPIGGQFIHLTSEQAADCPAATHLPGHLGHKDISLADKAYDAEWTCRKIEDCGAMPNVPKQANRNSKACFSQTLYRICNAIGRFYSEIRHFRRIATRYEKKGTNYLAMINPASTIVWMRIYESMT